MHILRQFQAYTYTIPSSLEVVRLAVAGGRGSVVTGFEVLRGVGW